MPHVYTVSKTDRQTDKVPFTLHLITDEPPFSHWISFLEYVDFKCKIKLRFHKIIVIFF